MTAVQIVQNFAHLFGPLQSLIWALAEFTGGFAVVIGLVRMGRSKQGHHQGGGFPLVVLGAFLLNFVWTVQTATETFFPGASPLSAMAYSNPSGSAASIMTQAAVGIIVLLGWGACFRGLYYLHESNTGHNNTFWKGITHLLGGGLAVNFVMLLHAIAPSIGLSGGALSGVGL